MKTQVNIATLQGRLGATPEIKVINENKSYARVSIAVNDNYKNSSNEWVENVHWFRLVFWNKKTELAKKFEKGNLVRVTGKLVTNTFTDKEGVINNVVELVVRSIESVDTNKENKEEEE